MPTFCREQNPFSSQTQLEGKVYFCLNDPKQVILYFLKVYLCLNDPNQGMPYFF